MYDLLLVGAGISAATLCACLKDRLKICVVEVRPHLGGNCHDYQAAGSFIHRYGPHVFHSRSPAVVEFLSRYTEWVPYRHRVEAEVEEGGGFRLVPFPYCRATARVLGRSLSEAEVLEKFFHGYSRKMWGLDWERLPDVVRGRVPKETRESPDYFPGQFVALPRHGYTRLLENMVDGVEILLGAGPQDWQDIPARRIVYCGRPDLLRPPGERVSYGEKYGLTLDFRSLDIAFTLEDWGHQAPVVNFCSPRRPHTRKTCYACLTGGRSRVVSYETPFQASPQDPAPYYPVPLADNLEKFRRLKHLIERDHPHLLLSGRLGTYKYLDMFQAVGQALALAKNRLGELP